MPDHGPTLRRLLVITYHYPPDGAIGGFRWAGFSKYLVRLGWEVHIVTASSAAADFRVPGVYVHVGARRRTVNDLYNSAAARLRSVTASPGGVPQAGDPSAATVSPAPQRRSPLGRAIAGVRRSVGALLYFPDYARGWVLRASITARGLLRANDFDLVITSGPPHSVHIAGLLATLGRREPRWIDMRDPWAVVHSVHAKQDRTVRAERFLLSLLEHWLLRRAQRVIVNTEEFAATMRRSEPDVRAVCVPNGIDAESLPERAVPQGERRSVAHVGALYLGRNLSQVLAAMRAMARDRPESVAALNLDIAGPMDERHRAELNADLAAGGLTNSVTIHGVTPRAKALEILNGSRLALVLAQNQKMCVPAKLYECMGLGVPTLVIAEGDSAAANEARRIGAMTVDNDDVAGIRAVLEDVLAGRIPPKVVSAAPISYRDLAVGMDQLLREEAGDQRHTTQRAATAGST